MIESEVNPPLLPRRRGRPVKDLQKGTRTPERIQAISVKYISNHLWGEAKAQATLQGMTIYQWLSEAIEAHLLSESVLRNKVTVTKCEMCGVKFDTNHKRIMHHDEPNTREAGVVKVLCSKCHRIRHKELGWGYPGRPQRFKCALCQKYYSVSQIDHRIWQSPETGKRVNLCLWCTCDITKVTEWDPVNQEWG